MSTCVRCGRGVEYDAGDLAYRADAGIDGLICHGEDEDAVGHVPDLSGFLGEGERFVVLSEDADEVRVAIMRRDRLVEAEAWGIAPTWADAAKLAILARCPDYIVDPEFSHLSD